MVTSTHSAQTDQPRLTVTPQKPFTRNSQTQGRILREYSGILPCIKHSVSHMLRCEHLRALPDEQFAPYKVQDEFTHQLWIWYRESADASPLKLIFRNQFNFSLPNQDSDTVAIAITDFLAELLWDATDSELLLQASQDESDWIKAVELQLSQLAQA